MAAKSVVLKYFDPTTDDNNNLIKHKLKCRCCMCKELMNKLNWFHKWNFQIGIKTTLTE